MWGKYWRKKIEQTLEGKQPDEQQQVKLNYGSATCIRIFLNPKIFLCGFKDFHVHMYPDSLSVRQLICKANFASCEHFLFMLQMCHKHFFARLTCLRRPIRPYDIERSLRMSSRRLEQGRLPESKSRISDIALGTILNIHGKELGSILLRHWLKRYPEP